MKNFIKLLLLALFVIPFQSSIGWAQNGNFAHGNGAGISLGQFAQFNTFVGDSAGRTMATGSYGTFIGKNAGFNLNNDTDNTILGSFASYRSVTGIDNVIIGARAGYQNAGSDNTFVGNMSGHHNTTGLDLTFIGEDAGYRNTTGADNVFIGEDAGYNNNIGNDNTFVGNAAGRQNTSGYRNTAIGNEALFDLGGPADTDAHHNTAVGDSAGIDNGTGTYNTFLGAASGAATESGSYNTFLGASAGYDNDRLTSSGSAATGLRNTYVGYRTGHRTRTGVDNTGLGAYSDMLGFASGLFRERNRTTFIGARVVVWADDAIAFGYESDARKQYAIAMGNESNSDGVNSIAIGYQASVTSDNQAVIGNNMMQSIGGSVNWTATSDGRFKTSIEENIPGLKFVDRLKPVSYQYNIRALHEQSGFTTDSVEQLVLEKEKIRYSGFIAQEVEQAANEIDYEFSGVDVPSNAEGKYGLRYAEFTVPMVKAIQELHEKVKSQEEIIQQQKDELLTYQSLFSKLESRIELLEANNVIVVKQEEPIHDE